MTEEQHCYENAVTERVNGILKDEFYLDQYFFSDKHAKMATKSAIEQYNKRLHLSLGYKLLIWYLEVVPKFMIKP